MVVLKPKDILEKVIGLELRQAKAIARVPLLANGDVHEPHHVRDKFWNTTKADGVLIARGALGNPWFFFSL
jgi:tRNA-dihydrouridine synthase B